MRAAVIFVLFALVAVASGQTPQNFGTQYQCTAGTANSVSYTALTLTLDATITCSATGSYTVGLYLDTSFSGTLSNLQGVSALLVVNAGFSITASASNTVTVTLSSSTVAAFNTGLWASITTALTAKAGFIQVDASGNAVTTIPIAIQNKASISATFTISNSAGTTALTNNYALVAINLNVPNLVFGTAYAITAWANQTFTYTDTAATTTASVWLSAQTSGTLTVTKSTTPTTPAPSGYTPLNVYLNIDLSAAADASPFNAVISYTYTAAQLTTAGISTANAAHLKLAYYDTVTSQWVFPSGGSVDTSSMVVAQSTTHFSQWGVYGSSGVAALTANAFVVAVAALFAVLMA